MRTTTFKSGLLIGVAALALSACGDDDDTSSSTSAPDTAGSEVATTTATSPSTTSAGTTGTAASGEPVRLAAVIPNMSDPFWSSIACGAQREADARGVDLQLYTSTSTDENQIAQNFQSATLSPPDGLLATPFNNNQFIAQYQQLMADGVPVVTGNGTSPPAEYQVIFSGSDTAKFAADLIADVPEGPGSMVYLGGAPGIPPLESRTFPFVAEVQSLRPDLERLPDDYSGFDINKTTTNVSALLLAHPDLKLIIAADGPDAVGAAAALKQADKAGEITLIAFDAVPPEVEALKDGTITALIAQAPFQIGREQVASLVDYLAAHPDGGPVTPIEPKTIDNAVLTADNVDDPANADFVYTESC